MKHVSDLFLLSETYLFIRLHLESTRDLVDLLDVLNPICPWLVKSDISVYSTSLSFIKLLIMSLLRIFHDNYLD